MVLRRIPNTPAVTIIQLISCVTAILLSQLIGLLKLEKLSLATLKASNNRWHRTLDFLGVFVVWCALCVGRLHQHAGIAGESTTEQKGREKMQVSNVDTVIVFRACVPLLVAVADYLWLVKRKHTHTHTHARTHTHTHTTPTTIHTPQHKHTFTQRGERHSCNFCEMYISLVTIYVSYVVHINKSRKIF